MIGTMNSRDGMAVLSGAVNVIHHGRPGRPRRLHRDHRLQRHRPAPTLLVCMRPFVLRPYVSSPPTACSAINLRAGDQRACQPVRRPRREAWKSASSAAPGRYSEQAARPSTMRWSIPIAVLLTRESAPAAFFYCGVVRVRRRSAPGGSSISIAITTGSVRKCARWS